MLERVAHYLVKYRKVLFFITVAAALACACLIPFVNVNKDMTRYIPSYMQSKVGLDIMASEFGESSLFRVMFENLPEDQQEGMVDKLKTVPGVSDVDYGPGPDYHNGSYTLYNVTVDGGTYSDEASQAHVDLGTFAKGTGYTYYLDSAVIDAKMDNLGTIIAFAMVILLIILVAMCKSWFEPVLLLFTLGMAVALNMGTNIIFDSVSDTTFSIAGVFQLVLSLDYSVMLMNRYRAERETTDDIPLAMERAVRNAFGSITSSSLTTIVGLSCLVLMSFTIGRDMGLVLAKGVLFSLICVFVIMPCLVIWSDSLIRKTAKRSFHPKMKWMAKASARGSYAILAAFLLIFCGGFALRNVAEASFVLPSLNPDHQVVEKAFPSGSQVVVVYDRVDEAATPEVEDTISKMEGVTSVTGYASTLGKTYTASELAKEMDMDETFVRMLYYYKDFDGNYRPMSLNTFASLICYDIAGNSSFSSQLSGYDTSGLSTLITLTAPSNTTCERTAENMTNFLSSLSSGSSVNISADDMKQLYLLYYMKCPDAPTVATSSMTLPAFVSFLQNSVLTNPQFSSLFTPEQIVQINMMANYTNVAAMTAQLDAASMAAATGMDAIQVAGIYYMAGKSTMSIQEFFTFIVSTPAIAENIPAEQLAQIKQVLGIINASVAGVAFTPADMARFLSMDESAASQLYLYHAYVNGGAENWTVSAYNLISFLVSDAGQQAIGSLMDSSTIAQLQTMLAVMTEGINGTAYSPTGMYNRLSELGSSYGGSMGSIDANGITLLYLYRDSRDLGSSSQTETLEGFVNFIADDVINDPLFSSFIDDSMRNDILDAQKTMNDSKGKLVSPTKGRIVIGTSFSAESDQMKTFIADVKTLLDDKFTETYYLVGEGPMAIDMTAGFMDELNFITLITAAAIFLIVLLTFRNLAIPIILVALIQGSFFWVMALNGLAGSPMYYVAIIIVQAILMGATIDYAILFTSHYRENRPKQGKQESIEAAYKGSIPTMLTSGSILVAVTFVLGIFMGGSAVAKICLTIAEGSAIALILVIFILPGTLAALDRFTAGKNRLIETKDGEGAAAQDVSA